MIWRWGRGRWHIQEEEIERKEEIGREGGREKNRLDSRTWECSYAEGDGGQEDKDFQHHG